MHARTLLVDAMFGGQSARAALDSGASGLALSLKSPAGDALSRGTGPSSEGQSMGVGGAARVRKVEGTAVVVDATLLKAEVSLTEETPGQTNAQCKYDARIGMRFLKHCTLVISQAETTMHCDPPSP